MRDRLRWSRSLGRRVLAGGRSGPRAQRSQEIQNGLVGRQIELGAHQRFVSTPVLDRARAVAGGGHRLHQQQRDARIERPEHGEPPEPVRGLRVISPS